MSLSKRPKGPEIEEYVQEYFRREINSHERDGHSPKFDWLSKLRNDMDLLMAHLKLEFRDIESVPKKRVVGKATKKKPEKPPHPPNPNPVEQAYYLTYMQRLHEETTNCFRNYPSYW